MTKTLFPPQTFVGFEHLLNELDFIGRSSHDNYPPHNICLLYTSDAADE